MLFSQDPDPILPIRPTDTNHDIGETAQLNDNINLFQNTSVKPGIKLPTTSIEWHNANEYFKANLNIGDNIINVNSEIISLQDLIYTYFKSNFGTHNNE